MADVKNSSEKLSQGVKSGLKTIGGSISGAFSRIIASTETRKKPDLDKTLDALDKLAKLKDAWIFTKEEFDRKKKEQLLGPG